MLFSTTFNKKSLLFLALYRSHLPVQLLACLFVVFWRLLLFSFHWPIHGIFQTMFLSSFWPRGIFEKNNREKSMISNHFFFLLRNSFSPSSSTLPKGKVVCASRICFLFRLIVEYVVCITSNLSGKNETNSLFILLLYRTFFFCTLFFIRSYARNSFHSKNSFLLKHVYFIFVSFLDHYLSSFFFSLPFLILFLMMSI